MTGAYGMGTIRITASTGDGRISQNEDNYTGAHDASTGTVDNTSVSINIGQILTGGRYYIYRGFIPFNTSLLTGKKLMSASLHVWGNSSSGLWNYIAIQQGSGGAPHQPLIDEDYNKTQYSGNGGQILSGNFQINGWNTIILNAFGLGTINLTGTTIFPLRVGQDITENAPLASELLNIGSTEDTGHEPYLDVEFESLDGVMMGNLNWGPH